MINELSPHLSAAHEQAHNPFSLHASGALPKSHRCALNTVHAAQMSALTWRAENDDSQPTYDVPERIHGDHDERLPRMQ